MFKRCVCVVLASTIYIHTSITLALIVPNTGGVFRQPSSGLFTNGVAAGGSALRDGVATNVATSTVTASSAPFANSSWTNLGTEEDPAAPFTTLRSSVRWPSQLPWAGSSSKQSQFPTVTAAITTLLGSGSSSLDHGARQPSHLPWAGPSNHHSQFHTLTAVVTAFSGARSSSLRGSPADSSSHHSQFPTLAAAVTALSGGRSSSSHASIPWPKVTETTTPSATRITNGVTKDGHTRAIDDVHPHPIFWGHSHFCSVSEFIAQPGA